MSSKKQLKQGDVIDPSVYGISPIEGLKFNEDINYSQDDIANIPKLDLAKQYSGRNLSENRLPQSNQDIWENISEIGQSRFDQQMNIGQLANVENARGEMQSGVGQITNGILKGVVLTGTTFLNGTVGMLAGLGALIDGDETTNFWNNDFSNLMNGITEWSEKVLPNYYTDFQREHPLHFDANFIGDKFLKNLGFTAGALLASNALNTAVLGIGKAVLSDALFTALSSSKASQIAFSTLGSATSAVNEGSIEALNNTKDWKTNEINSENNEYIKLRQQAQYYYENNKGKNFVNVHDAEGNVIGSQDTAYLNYVEAVKQIDENHKNNLARIETDAKKIGNRIIAHNIPLLMATNLIELSGLYAGGYKTGRAIGNTSYGIATARGLNRAATEAFEEGSQADIASASEYRYKEDLENFKLSGSRPDTAEKVLSWTDAYARAITENLSDDEVWSERLIGGLTGFLGAPTFGSRANKSEENLISTPRGTMGWSGGFFAELKQAGANRQKLVDATAGMALATDEKVKNAITTIIRNEEVGQMKNDALRRQSKFDFENAESLGLMNLVSYFSNAGKVDDFISRVENAYATDDKNLAAIIDATSTKDDTGKYVSGPFIENGNPMTSTPEGKQRMIDKLDKSKNEMIDGIKRYTDIRRQLDQSEIGNLVSDAELLELTWLNFAIEDFEKRGRTMASEIQQFIKDIVVPKIREQMDLLQSNYEKTLQQVSDSDNSQNNNVKNKEAKEKAIRQYDSLIEYYSNLIAQKPEDFFNNINQYITGRSKYDAIKSAITDKGFGLKYTEQQDLLTKLDDMRKLVKMRTDYYNKFNEYTRHPEKILESEDDAINKINKQLADIEKSTIKTKISSATDYNNFLEIIDSLSDNELKYIPEIIDELKDSNEFAKSYKEVADATQNLWFVAAEIKDDNERNLAFLTINSLFDANVSSEKDIIDTLNMIADEYDNNADFVSEKIIRDLISNYNKRKEQIETQKKDKENAKSKKGNKKKDTEKPKEKPKEDTSTTNVEEETTEVEQSGETGAPDIMSLMMGSMAVGTELPPLDSDVETDKTSEPEPDNGTYTKDGFIYIKGKSQREILDNISSFLNEFINDTSKTDAEKHELINTIKTKGIANNSEGIDIKKINSIIKKDIDDYIGSESLSEQPSISEITDAEAKQKQRQERIPENPDREENVDAGIEILKSDIVTEYSIPYGIDHIKKKYEPKDDRLKRIQKIMLDIGARRIMESGLFGKLYMDNPNIKIHFLTNKNVIDDTVFLAIELTDKVKRTLSGLSKPTTINNKQYQIVGVLRNSGGPRYENMIKTLDGSFEKDSDTEWFASQLTTTISVFSSGRFVTSENDNKPELKNVADIVSGLQLGDYGFSIYKDNAELVSFIGVHQDDCIALNSNNPSNRRGTVWLMLRGNDGMFFPTSIKIARTRNYDFDNGSELADDFKDNIEKLANPELSVEERFDAKKELQSILYLNKNNDVHFSDKYVKIAGTRFDYSDYNDLGKLVDYMIDTVKSKDIIFNVSERKLSQKTSRDKLFNAGILQTNLLQKEFINGSFTINDIGESIQSDRRRVEREAVAKAKSNVRQSRTGRVYFNGNEFIYTEDNVTGETKYFFSGEQEGLPVDDLTNQLIRAGLSIENEFSGSTLFNEDGEVVETVYSEKINGKNYYFIKTPGESVKLCSPQKYSSVIRKIESITAKEAQQEAMRIASESKDTLLSAMVGSTEIMTHRVLTPEEMHERRLARRLNRTQQNSYIDSLSDDDISLFAAIIDENLTRGKMMESFDKCGVDMSTITDMNSLLAALEESRKCR